MIRLQEDRGAVIVGDADRECTASFRLAQHGQSERRRATCRHGNDHIMRSDRMLPHEAGRLLAFVLGALHGAQQGIASPGHEQEQPILRPAEGGYQLGAVLDGKPAGGPGSCIDEPAALA